MNLKYWDIKNIKIKCSSLAFNYKFCNFHIRNKEQWAYYEENPFIEEDIDEDFESEEDFEDETYTRKGSKKRRAPGRKPKVSINVLLAFL